MSDLQELRRLADLLIWAAGENPNEPDWGFDPDAAPNSAYAQWITALSPERVIVLLDVVEAARRYVAIHDGSIDGAVFPARDDLRAALDRLEAHSDE